MSYFNNVQSLSGLKKQYRDLAKEHHPDRGGSTEAMQRINNEFEKLFVIWETKPDTDTNSGYENDYSGATAREYTGHVWNEYGWKGSRYDGQSPAEVQELIRVWLKKTYPSYRFSVTRTNYDVIDVGLMAADFDAFVEGSTRVYKEVHRYSLKEDPDLTDRAKDVLDNIISYAESFNYDNSDAMVDYFDRNFYFHAWIGKHDRPYKLTPAKLKTRPGTTTPEVFTHREGPAHKAIRVALSGLVFQTWETRSGIKNVLGKVTTWEDGEKSFYPNDYSSSKQAAGRMEKLSASGHLVKLTGHNGGFIECFGYTQEVQSALDREREEYVTALKEWQNKHTKATDD